MAPLSYHPCSRIKACVSGHKKYNIIIRNCRGKVSPQTIFFYSGFFRWKKGPPFPRKILPPGLLNDIICSQVVSEEILFLLKALRWLSYPKLRNFQVLIFNYFIIIRSKIRDHIILNIFKRRKNKKVKNYIYEQRTIISNITGISYRVFNFDPWRGEVVGNY